MWCRGRTNSKGAFQRWVLAVLGVLVAATAASCGRNDDESEHGPLRDDYDYLRIVTPREGDTLTGIAVLEYDYVFSDPIATLEVGFKDDLVEQKSPGERSIQLDVSRVPDGEQTLEVRVVLESGKEFVESVTVALDTPGYSLERFLPDQDAYANGEQVCFTLDYGEPGLDLDIDLGDLDSDFDQDGVAVRDAGDGTYEVTYSVSEGNSLDDGRRVAVVTATNAEGESVLNHLEFSLRNAPRLPVVVEGGIFTESLPVTLVDSNAPELTAITASPSLVTGGEATVSLEWVNTESSAANRIVVKAEGYSGSYVLPVSEDDASANLRLTLPDLKPDLSGLPMTLLVGVVDSAGRALLWLRQQIVLALVGTGGIQVTLTWGNKADLDLAVTDPNGRTVSWRGGIEGGGSLDLDSNSECLENFVSAENAFWTDGSEVPGEYQVRVKLFAACEELEADYTGTIKFCGRTRNFGGHFIAADADASPDTLGEVIETFDVSCANRAFGSVKFEKRGQVPGPGGALPAATIGATPTPARFVGVKAIRVSDSECLAYAVTDADGKYDLRFTNDGDPNYIVQAEARSGTITQPASGTGCGTLDEIVHVEASTGGVHTFSSAAIDGSAEPEKALDLLVPVEPPTGAAATNATSGPQSSGGAFNILDTALRGIDWFGSHQGEVLPDFYVKWSDGVALPSQYDGGQSPPCIQLLGDADHDEWDDSVIAHEFSHFVIDKESKSDSPGGAAAHAGVPRGSWSEGIASGFGQTILERDLYIDSSVGGGMVMANPVNVESLSVTPGTTPANDQTGNVNEWLVAGVTYDLMDGIAASDSSDSFDRDYFATFGSVFEHLKASGRANRGAQGEDLVDFLDGFRCKCQELTAIGAPDRDPDLKALLADPTVNFPYDHFQAGASPPALQCF